MGWGGRKNGMTPRCLQLFFFLKAVAQGCIQNLTTNAAMFSCSSLFHFLGVLNIVQISFTLLCPNFVVLRRAVSGLLSYAIYLFCCSKTQCIFLLCPMTNTDSLVGDKHTLRGGKTRLSYCSYEMKSVLLLS